MPQDFNNFFEPFIGGGALSIHLKLQNTIINDISKELIDTYLCIKEDPKRLIILLDNHTSKHQQKPEQYYYEIREQDRDLNWKSKNKYTKSSRFIYLNKSCFNGLYRVNSKGYFNVPWNKKLIVKLYEKDNILNLHNFLNTNIKILNEDFENVVKTAKKGDFIFFDPPYDLLNKSSFDNYNKTSFGIEGQKRLSKTAHILSNKGCYIMITNHNTELINELYKDFKIDVVNVKRLINSNAKKRVGKEVIIYNY